MSSIAISIVSIADLSRNLVKMRSRCHWHWFCFIFLFIANLFIFLCCCVILRVACFLNLAAEVLQKKIRFFKLVKNFFLLIYFISIINATNLKARSFIMNIYASSYIIMAAWRIFPKRSRFFPWLLA